MAKNNMKCFLKIASTTTKPTQSHGKHWQLLDF